MKKRIFKGVLIAALLVCVYALGASGVVARAADAVGEMVISSRYDLEITEPALEEYADGSGCFTARATCSESVEGKSIKVAVAFYSADGRMADCWFADHDLGAGDAISIGGAVPEYDKLGVYFFDSDSLTPIRPAVLRLLDGQLSSGDTEELLTELENRLAEQEKAVTQLTREMDSLLNGLSGGTLLSKNDGRRTVTDGGASNSCYSVRSTITGWTTYMTKDIMFGGSDAIEGIILGGLNIEKVEGFEEVEIEIQFRNFDDSLTNHIVPNSKLIKSVIATVKPNNVDNYHLLVPISRDELAELNDEFILGFRVLSNGSVVRMEPSRNSSCILKAKNDEKLEDNENNYKYVGYYTSTAKPSGSYSTCSPDLFFSTVKLRDVSSIIDDTLTKAGRAADAAAVGEAISALAMDSVKLQLPEYYDLVVGDTFELFYKGIINCVDYSQYEFDLSLSGWDKSAINAYSRKAVLKPTEAHVGTHKLTVVVRDNGGYEVDRGTVQLRVHPVPTSPAEETVVLCMGDSLTSGGVWPAELYRRMTAADGTPTGWGLENIKFIGTKVNKGANYEGVGGWTYNSYMGKKSPFRNPETGETDFTWYAARQGVDSIDHAIILLGWNNTGNSEDTYKASARKLLDKLFAAFPDCQVTLMGLQVPSQDGFGHNYGASWPYYSKLQFVWKHQAWNRELCEEDAYAGKMSFVSIAGQFDTEYNMPSAAMAVNTRNTTTEIVGTNGVHPATSGYYQIADAAARHMVGKLK